MREYRAYVLAPDGVAILAVHYLHCDNLEQAFQRARELAVDHPVELWDPPIRVATFEPKRWK
jgi:hypothetical protein